jgi:hypothetical protein
MKLIFISSCKPISNEKLKTIQYNSINSWKWIDCEKEILIFNRDESIKNMCDELKVTNIDDYESSEFSDLPTWRTMRDKAVEIANDDDIIIWVNSDIVFDDTLYFTISELKLSLSEFILTGKRKNWPNYWRLNDKEEISKIEFDKIGNEYEVDYFIFNKKHFSDLPKFFIARMRFDNYLLKMAIDNVEYTLDSTFAINSYHHQHGYGENLDQSWADASLSDIKFEIDRQTNQTLSPIANIDECRYRIKVENKKLSQVLLKK